MEFLADLSALDQMIGYIREEASKLDVGEKSMNKIELACEEALVNIISYAYPELKGKIILECRQNGHRFEIMMKDHGIAFNPIDAEVNPQFDKPMQERNIGGLGLYLIRKIIDEAIYQREDEVNILRLAFVI
jgi:serine/threonine-protein kinase RsbW